MSTLQITRKMASVRESSSDVFVNLSDQLGGLVLKEEQKLAVEAPFSENKYNVIFASVRNNSPHDALK